MDPKQLTADQAAYLAELAETAALVRAGLAQLARRAGDALTQQRWSAALLIAEIELHLSDE